MSTRKMNAFSNETCLNVKHQPFIFQHIVQIYLNTIDTCRLDHMRDATAAIAGSVVETTHRPGLFSSTTDKIYNTRNLKQQQLLSQFKLHEKINH